MRRKVIVIWMLSIKEVYKTFWGPCLHECLVFGLRMMMMMMMVMMMMMMYLVTF